MIHDEETDYELFFMSAKNIGSPFLKVFKIFWDQAPLFIFFNKAFTLAYLTCLNKCWLINKTCKVYNTDGMDSNTTLNLECGTFSYK